MSGTLEWVMENVASLMEVPHLHSASFRLDLYNVYLNSLLVLNVKELSKDILVMKYSILRQINSLMDKSFVL